MSSIYTTVAGKTIKGFAGQEYPALFYIQFVPGVVVEAVHSEESLAYKGQESINTILAKPHISNKTQKQKSRLDESNRYYPLLRTMHDIPSKGDPVLLCTFGRIQYYLGPLNTMENNPTWNDDPSYKPEIVPQFNKPPSMGKKLSERDLRGESINFNKNRLFTRLSKKRKEDLDYGKAVFETTGDTVIEGRHGNSLRIGSRSDKPYIFISNDRDAGNNVETLGDGSIISITSNGSLQQHFNLYNIDTGQLDENETPIVTPINGFTLASDLVVPPEEAPNRFMGSLVSSVNNNQDSQELIYNYNNNQMLLHSDRITINSKLDDIFLSSNKDIHIGTKRHLTISTSNNLFIESDGVNIGNPNTNGVTMESMVLGETLKEVLTEMLSLFTKIKIMTQTGPQGIQSDPAFVATTQSDIQNITTKIENITSTKHKIEQG